VKKILHESELKIAEDQKKMLDEAKRELGETVLLAVEKVLHEKMDATKEKEFIERHVN
jgi:F0F1-type ATP synthase membrane subunit b/b'